jgi:hypothetical protein
MSDQQQESQANSGQHADDKAALHDPQDDASAVP